MSSVTGVESPLLAFDAQRSELAIVTGDGRVRLFNVVQQRLNADITPQLSGPVATEIYSCLCWGASAPTKSKQVCRPTIASQPSFSRHNVPHSFLRCTIHAQKNKQSTGGSDRSLFLGSLSGTVRCYDAARAHLKWTAVSPIDGAITALACSPSLSTTLLVVGKNGGAALLDTSTGNVLSSWQASKHPLSAAAFLTDGTPLVAGSSISSHDPSTGAKLHKWTGHATTVTSISVSLDGTFFCSSASGERSVAVWSTAVNPVNGKLRHKSAVTTLNVDSTGVGGISVFKRNVAVVSGGGLSLFDVGGEAAADATSTAAWTSRRWASSSSLGGAAAAAATTAAQVLCAVVDGEDEDGVVVTVAVGSSTLKPRFLQSLRVGSGGGHSGEVCIPLGSGHAQTQGGGAGDDVLLLFQKNNDGEKQAKVGGGRDITVVSGADYGVTMAGKRKAADGANDTEMDVDVDVDVEEEQLDDQPTFAERIAALSLDTDTTTNNNAAMEQKQLPAPTMKADSLSVLLSQALQSNDKVLLERCLAVRNHDVINKTVKRLAPADAASFLRIAVQRLQSKPNRGEQLATWIRAVLLFHTAYLAGVGATQNTLGYLYQLIEARLASYQPLLALSGRLDLVLSSSRVAAAAAGNGDEDDGGGGGVPLVTIEVGDDDDVVVEDAYLGGDESDDDDDDGSEEEEEDDFLGDDDDEDNLSEEY